MECNWPLSCSATVQTAQEWVPFLTGMSKNKVELVASICLMFQRNNKWLFFQQRECAECRGRRHIWQVILHFSNIKVCLLQCYFVLNCQNLSSFRVLTELVNKMRDMQMDKTELGCLRAIVLFNPGAWAMLKYKDLYVWQRNHMQASWAHLNVCCIFLQMLKDSPTPARWSSLEKRSMHHWKRTANRDTLSSREGELSTVITH